MRRLIIFAVAVLVSSTGAGAGDPVESVPGVRLLRGRFVQGAQPDGNTVIIDVPAGLVIVDTGRHTEHTQSILAFAKAAGRPIAAIVNTHWHLDHIGGNAAIRDAHPGVRIYASASLEGALAGFLASYRNQLQELLLSSRDPEQRTAFQSEVALIDSGARLAPDVVIASSGRRAIGGRTFLVGLEDNAVTAGDVWLLDETRGVLIAGDLVTLPAPLLDTACPTGWKDALDRLAALDFHLLVPGHGAPMTKTQFETYRTAFGALLACADGTLAKDRCIDQWVAAIAPLTSEDEAFTRSLMAYSMDVLREAAKRRSLCGE